MRMVSRFSQILVGRLDLARSFFAQFRAFWRPNQSLGDPRGADRVSCRKAKAILPRLTHRRRTLADCTRELVSSAFPRRDDCCHGRRGSQEATALDRCHSLGSPSDLRLGHRIFQHAIHGLSSPRMRNCPRASSPRRSNGTRLDTLLMRPLLIPTAP